MPEFIDPMGANIPVHLREKANFYAQEIEKGFVDSFFDVNQVMRPNQENPHLVIQDNAPQTMKDISFGSGLLSIALLHPQFRVAKWFSAAVGGTSVISGYLGDVLEKSDNDTDEQRKALLAEKNRFHEDMSWEFSTIAEHIKPEANTVDDKYALAYAYQLINAELVLNLPDGPRNSFELFKQRLWREADLAKIDAKNDVSKPSNIAPEITLLPTNYPFSPRPINEVRDDADTKKNFQVNQAKDCAANALKERETLAHLFDAEVMMTASNFETDGEIQQLVNTYLSSDAEDKYLHFKRGVTKHLEQEKKFHELQNMLQATSQFFSQVASLTNIEPLRKGALAISCTTGALSAVKQMSNAVNLVDAKGLSIKTIATCLTSANSVLGVVSLVSSLFGNNADDAIAKQLKQIHETIIGMWQDTRHCFDTTWKMLNEMEVRNDRRFKSTLQAIRFTHHELRAFSLYTHAELTHRMSFLQDSINKALSYMIQRDVDTIISEIKFQPPLIRKMSKENFKKWVREDFKRYLIAIRQSLVNDLTQPINNGTNEIEAGKLRSTDEQLVHYLTGEISEESPDDPMVPLGLYMTLAKQLQPSISLSQIDPKKIAEPYRWISVCNVLVGLWHLCFEKGWPLDAEETVAYLEAMDEICSVAKHILNSVTAIANNPQFWRGLMAEYQQHFDVIKMEIDGLQPRSEMQSVLNESIRWNMLTDSSSNIRDFKSLPNIRQIDLDQLSRSLRWIGVRGELNEKLRSTHAGEGRHMDSGLDSAKSLDLTLTLSQAQFSAITSHESAQANNIIRTMKNNIVFALAAYYSVIKPAVVHYPQNVGSTTENRDWDFSLFIMLNLSILGDASYQFAKGNLFKISPLHPKGYDDEEGFGVPGQYQYSIPDYERGFTSGHISLFESDSCILSKESEIEQALESYALAPARQSIGLKYNNAKVSVDSFILRVKVSYFKIVAFMKLYDPKCRISLSSNAIRNLGEAIVDLSGSNDDEKITGAQNARSTVGKAETLNKLYDIVDGALIDNTHRRRIRAHVWQEELWPYMREQTPNISDFDTEDLRAKVTSNYTQAPWYQGLKKVAEELSQIRTVLRENQYAITNALSESRSVIRDQESQLSAVFSVLKESKVILKHLDVDVLIDDSYQQCDYQLPEHEPYHHMDDQDEEQLGQPRIDDDLPDLQRLCSDCHSSLINIKQLLAEAAKNETLDRVLNTAGIYDRPLYRAICIRRTELVELLLSFDAMVTDADKALINRVRDPRLSKIAALIDFYSYLQRLDLQPDCVNSIKPGRVLYLVNEGAQKLQKYEKNIKPGMFLFGGTGEGKSTILNSALGTEYEYDDYGDLKPKEGQNEFSPTSGHFASTTTYPEIFTFHQDSPSFLLVDLQGYSDNRGISYDIAAGITRKMLGSVVKEVASIAIVCKSTFLSRKSDDLIEAINAFSALIKQSPENMNNVLFIVNEDQSPRKDEETIIRILRRHMSNEGLTNDAKFFLERIEASHLFCIKLPDNELPRKLMDLLSKRQRDYGVRPITDFDFELAGSSHRAFTALLQRVNEYKNNKKTMLVEDCIKSLNSMRELIREKFIISVDYEGGIDEQLAYERDQLNTTLSAQEKLRSKLLDALDAMLVCLKTHKGDTADRQHDGALLDLNKSLQCYNVASQFLDRVSNYFEADLAPIDQLDPTLQIPLAYFPPAEEVKEGVSDVNAIVY